MAIASCSESDGWIAPSCGPEYKLGCVGDGRPKSETTPGSLPTRSCAKDALSLFRVHVTTSQPREDIAQCRIRIVDSSGDTVAEYTLASGTTGTGGKLFGCSLGQTPADVGIFSYSSCCDEKDELTFYLDANSSTGQVVQAAGATGPCAHYPPEVGVELRAQPPT
jgi:hypothetical protein